MDLSWFGVAWLCGACLCLAAGMGLTRRQMQVTRDEARRLRGCPCGASLHTAERFCGQCGRRVGRNEPEKRRRSHER
jgi:hypothetical protein